MKVDKAKFDAVLQQLINAAPLKSKDIKTEGKAGRIIPPMDPKPSPEPEL